MNTVYTTMLIDNYSKCMVFGRKKIKIIQIESQIVGKKTEKNTHTGKEEKKIRKIKNKINNEKMNYNE